MKKGKNDAFFGENRLTVNTQRDDVNTFRICYNFRLQGSGSLVKGQYAGRKAPGQPLTRRHGQPFSQESNWLLSCLPARAGVTGTGPRAGSQGGALSPRRAFRQIIFPAC